MKATKLYEINKKFNAFLPNEVKEDDYTCVYVCKSDHFKERKSARVILTDDPNRCLLNPESGFSYSDRDWIEIRDFVLSKRDEIIKEWESAGFQLKFIL